MLTAVIFLPSAGLALGKDFAECRFLALGKEIFADKVFAERPLPSAALGKAFAVCLPGFAECPQHSAKRASAVVTRGPSNKRYERLANILTWMRLMV